jgi:electron transport complex protein RnfA
VSLIAVIAAAALADNIILAKMLGLCPFTGLSKRLDVAVGVGVATAAVLTLSAAAAWVVNATLLQNISSLQPLIFITLAAIVVQGAELAMRLWMPLMHRMLGLYLPLIATNCAVLGVMLLAVRKSPDSFIEAVARGFGGGVGFLLAMVCLALVRERITDSQVPVAMRGAPLTMITIGWMALAFSGLHGIF